MNNRKFALVVPALNEEEAIGGTLRRCLAAREKVQRETSIDEMVVVFVNDGSTDGTQDVVDQPEFDDVVKVRFEKNRGYGAAIKAGWRATDAEFVGFIDGDGTCEPNFCVDLLNAMEKQQADVVLASRMSPDSRMPLIRKVGNFIFARLLGLVSGHPLTDSASGFRIVRRSRLPLISPLPDGLHFTPAMSCICLLDPRLNIQEVYGMHYREREGRSKLSVVKDGIRFLWTILFSACVYSPIKTMLVTALIALGMFGLFSGVASILEAPDTAWLLSYLGVVTAMILVSVGVVTHQLNTLMIGPRTAVSTAERVLQSVLDYRRLIISGLSVFVLGTLPLLLAPPLIGGLPYPGQLGFALVVTLGALLAVGGVIQRVIECVRDKQLALIRDEYQVQAPERPAEADAASPPQGAPLTAGASLPANQ